MSKLGELLRNVSQVVDRLDDASQAGETDPIRLVDAMMGGEYSRPRDGDWWRLFGLNDAPTSKRELAKAWKGYASRSHPDAGGDAVSFAAMRELYERKLARLPE